MYYVINKKCPLKKVEHFFPVHFFPTIYTKHIYRKPF